MLTKTAFIQGVQFALKNAGFLNYANEFEADDHAVKLAAALTVDPAEAEFGPAEVAELADALVAMKVALDGAEAGLAAPAAAGVGPDTNAEAGFASAPGATGTAIGAGSTTGSETARPQGASAVAAQAAPAAGGVGPDTNAAASFASAPGATSTAVGDGSTTGSEMKVAKEWGSKLNPALSNATKIATVRQLAAIAPEHRQALVDHVNGTVAPKVASDQDILNALMG